MHYETVKGILSSQNGLNLYRGCQHGCIYCDSRSLCYQFQHDFEDIAVKQNGLSLLEDALRRKKKPCMIGTGSMSDPYMPLESQLGYTRKMLELICQYGFGAAVLTKSDLVLRDLDLLREINCKTKCVVQMTLTTADETLCRKVEPGVCTTKRRVEALKTLSREGIPTVVWLCPILPFLNDTRENIQGILEYCQDAGAKGVICFGMGLTLREGSREFFYWNLDRLFPGLKEEYIKSYGNSYVLNSPNNAQLMQLFHETCEKAGIAHNNDEIFRYLNTFEEKQPEQLRWF